MNQFFLKMKQAYKTMTNTVIAILFLHILYSKRMSSFQGQLRKSSNDEQDFLLAMELVNGSIPQITMKAAIKLGGQRFWPKQAHLSSLLLRLPLNFPQITKRPQQYLTEYYASLPVTLSSHAILSQIKMEASKDYMVQRQFPDFLFQMKMEFLQLPVCS